MKLFVEPGKLAVCGDGEQLVARGVLEHEASAHAAAERQERGRSQPLGQALIAGEDDAQASTSGTGVSALRAR